MTAVPPDLRHDAASPPLACPGCHLEADLLAWYDAATVELAQGNQNALIRLDAIETALQALGTHGRHRADLTVDVLPSELRVRA